MFPRFTPMMMCGFGCDSGKFVNIVLGEYMPPAFLSKLNRLTQQSKSLCEKYECIRKELSGILTDVKRSMPTVSSGRAPSAIDHQDSYYLAETLLFHEMTTVPVEETGEVMVNVYVGTSQADKFTVSSANWQKLKPVIVKGRPVCAKYKKVRAELDVMTAVRSRFEEDAYSAIVNWEQEESMRQIIRSHRGGDKALRGMFASALAKSKQEKKKN